MFSLVRFYYLYTVLYVWCDFKAQTLIINTDPLPAPGLSLIMSPFNQSFTWQTTSIKEIIEKKEDYLKFKTKNSTYELYKQNTIKH